jgi:hypothetical protein
MQPRAAYSISTLILALFLFSVGDIRASGPTIVSLSPNSGVVGTLVRINGANFGAAQASSSVTFNGYAATATGWSASAIVVIVPEGATTGKVTVIVSGATSNGETFTVVASPSSASLSMAFLGVAGLTTTDLREMFTNETSDSEFGDANLITSDLTDPPTRGGSVCSRRKKNPTSLQLKPMRTRFAGMCGPAAARIRLGFS